jgi:hypothetical protein
VTLQEWEDQQDTELDEQLSTLFRSTENPRPSAAFVSQTMKAVRGVPLMAGRRALRRSWIAAAGWAALIAAAAGIAAAVAINQPFVGEMFAALLARGIRIGLALIGMTHTGFAVFGVFATAAGIVARVLSTRDAIIAVMLLMAVSAVSLSMLNRLLLSQKESSSW